MKTVGWLVLAWVLGACGSGPTASVDPTPNERCDALEPGTTCAEAVEGLETDIAALQAQAHDRYTDEEAIAAVNAGGVQAASISYDPATSGLAATDVQVAIDEAEGRIDGLEAAQYTDAMCLAAVASAGYVPGPGFSGDYADLTNAPDLSVYATSAGLAPVATSGSYLDLSGRPAFATVATTGNYADLSNRPNLSTVASTGDYADLSNRPNLSTVATSGNYADLTNTPTLYTNADAVAAMETKANANPLNHDRYTDAEALSAVGAFPGSTYCGTSSSAYTGNIGGWAAAKSICETTCGSTTAHMCSAIDIERTWQLGIATPTTFPNGTWVSSSGVSVLPSGEFVRSCVGWSSNGATNHSIKRTDEGEFMAIEGCNSALRIDCCDR